MNYRLTIPVMHCFDDRYAAPAAVAFLSMLEHGAKDCFFQLYVLHSDITEAHQQMLKDVVARFPNASLEFIVPQDRVDKYFATLKNKNHYSGEVIFKLILPEVFPQYKRMMLADVDVLYCDDIAENYERVQNDNNYLVGHTTDFHCSWLTQFNHNYDENFSEEERDAIVKGINGCYIICNLEAMRRDGVSHKAVEYLQKNLGRLCQLEQDVLNLVCAGKISYLPQRSVICTYLWRVLKEDEKPYWKDAMEHPIQLHFPGPGKPWLEPGSIKSDLWWGYLARTPFFFEVAKKFTLTGHKTNWSFLGKIPFLEIWSTGHITQVKLARHFSLKPAIPFWHKKEKHRSPTPTHNSN